MTDALLDKRLATEHTLIARAATHPDETRQSCGWLTDEAFHDEIAATFWRGFRAGGNPANMQVALGDPYADALWSWLPLAADPYLDSSELARDVARYASLADAQADLNWLAKAIADGDYETTTTLIRKLADRTPSASIQTRSALEVADAFLELLDGDDYTIPTRISGLDRATGGLERKNLTIIAAPPSTGKSAIALQIARNVVSSGAKVLFASLEMPDSDLWARMACGDTGATWLDVRRKSATAEQIGDVRDMTLQLRARYARHLLIHDQMSTTADLWQRVAAERPDVLIVDHIRFCRDTDERGEHKRLGVITQRLRDIGKQFDCAVLACAQLNREHHARSEARPVLSDLRDSGEIEENADNVWMLYVDSDGKSKPTDQAAVEMELWIRKARNGQRDVKVNLIYNRVRQWIRHVSDPEED